MDEREFLLDSFEEEEGSDSVYLEEKDLDDDAKEEDDDEGVEQEQASFVCEECDYRWEDLHSIEDEWEEKSVVCPMCGCGSMNVTRL